MECNLNHSEKYTKMCIKLYLKFLFSNIQDGGSGGLVILSKKKQVSYLSSDLKLSEKIYW